LLAHRRSSERVSRAVDLSAHLSGKRPGRCRFSRPPCPAKQPSCAPETTAPRAGRLLVSACFALHLPDRLIPESRTRW
jgi:hypothetical protein